MVLPASDPRRSGATVAASPGGGGISVIICTKDRPADLANAIASIRASGQAGRQAEIVVVEETEAPREIPDARYVHLPREGRGFGYARNAGVRAARGDVLVFLDDDCEAEEGWMEGLTAPLRDRPDILGVAGAVMVRDCGPIGYAENILGFPGGGLRYLHQAQGRVVPTRHLSTCNCAYRRDAILRVGGFPEQAHQGGEDFLLAERVSALGPCVYTPAAVVYHRPRGRLPAILSWFIRRGQSELDVMWLTTHRWSAIQFLIRGSWTLRLLGLVTLVYFWPQTAWLLPLLVLGYYGVLLRRFHFARGYSAHRQAWWLVPVVKFTMDVGAEIGRWKALCTRDGRLVASQHGNPL